MHICKKKCRNLLKFCTFCGCGIPVYRYIGIPNGLKESDGAVDEVGKRLAFELAGSQQGYVNELLHFLLLALFVSNEVLDEWVRGVEDEVVGVRQLAVEG